MRVLESAFAGSKQQIKQRCEEEFGETLRKLRSDNKAVKRGVQIFVKRQEEQNNVSFTIKGSFLLGSGRAAEEDRC